MKSEKKDKKEIKLTLSFAWEIAYSIFIPLILLASGGKFLDEKFSTYPFLFLTGIVLSIFISSFVIFKKIFKIIKLLEQEGEEGNKKEKTF